MNEVKLPYMYVPDPTKGRPVFNASIYIGEPDLDPEIALNQIQVSARQENGNIVAIPQPIETGGGGVPLYNGSPVTLLIDQSTFSIKILNNVGAQVYFHERASAISEFPAAVDSADDLFALPNVGQGGIVSTLGRKTPYDGGHGEYMYDENSIAVADNIEYFASSFGGNYILRHDGTIRAEQAAIFPDTGVAYGSQVQAACATGLKVMFTKENGAYGVSGSFAMLGFFDFINGARLKFLAETAITVNGDCNAGVFRIDANSFPVNLWAVYFQSGDHDIETFYVENIKGDGRGAYAAKVNYEGEGKTTRVGNIICKQITDSRSGAIVGEEGFCGGIYATGPTNSTVAANCRTINIERGYGQDIYTTQADGVTENSSDYDSDFIRAFINEVTSSAYLNTAALIVRNIVTRGVQKRAVKISGLGNYTVESISGYGTRSATQMSDVVFVADSRMGAIEDIKGYGKFDNVVKLDGASFKAAYTVKTVKMYSEQAGLGCALMATNCDVVNAEDIQGLTDLERLIRYNGVTTGELKGLAYAGTKTSTAPLVDIQNCGVINLDLDTNTTWSGATGQTIYAQNSNRIIADGVIKDSYATAGQSIRYNNVTYFEYSGHVEGNKFLVFDEGSNDRAKLDAWFVETGTNQPISIASTDHLELNMRECSGDYTGAAMTAGVVALTGVDHGFVTGLLAATGMTDAGNDRGLMLTSCTRLRLKVNTISGAADPEMVRLSSCSKIDVDSISDSTKPVRILNTCTDIRLMSFGPGTATNDAGAETTVTHNVGTW